MPPSQAETNVLRFDSDISMAKTVPATASGTNLGRQIQLHQQGHRGGKASGGTGRAGRHFVTHGPIGDRAGDSQHDGRVEQQPKVFDPAAHRRHSKGVPAIEASAL